MLSFFPFANIRGIRALEGEPSEEHLLAARQFLSDSSDVSAARQRTNAQYERTVLKRWGEWCAAKPGEILDGVEINDRKGPYTTKMTKEKGDLFLVYLSKRQSRKRGTTEGAKLLNSSLKSYVSGMIHIWDKQNPGSVKPPPCFFTRKFKSHTKIRAQKMQDENDLNVHFDPAKK